MRAIRAASPSTLVLFTASFIFAFCLCAVPSEAQSGDGTQLATSTVVSPQPLITEVLDEAQLAVLKGNIHPLARPEFDLGTAPASLPMRRMLLILKRSPEQQSALRKLLDDQQDKGSPSYHKWLTPDQFGKQFGPADADIQAISLWLQSHGFQVSQVGKGRTVIEFSGSASQVQEAFHTSIHKYVVKGEQHWANAQDQRIPAALAPAVAGVLTLHNFLKKPQLHLQEHPVAGEIVSEGKNRHVTFPPQNGQPALNALGPQDYATIYNINPAYNIGFNGTGTTIGVVGRSNLFNAGEDVADFRNTAFSLCCGGFQIILNGPDPGDLGGGEEAEATLDSTWSGAVAPGATVDLVVSASTNTTDGTDLSELYIIENNLADVMTESFGSCEFFATDAQLVGASKFAEQAAAQGISYFVSTGDNGAEGCDDPSAPPAAGPVSVNFLASTAFNTAVGGTMFNENGQNAKYWGSTPPISETALSYIPEDVWNESSPTAGLWSGSGGASAGNIGSGGTTPGVPKPSWQSAVTGIPNDFVRDLPDVSLTAAGHDPYLLCLGGSCFPVNNQLFIYFVSGTSASTPSFAGIMALVDQQMINLNPAQSRRQGQANYVLYPLAALENLSQCNASSTTALPNANCVFNDTTVGNNVVPGETGLLYHAGVGYDLATGLGSVNVANLLGRWASTQFRATTTTLTLTPVTTMTHGQPWNVMISVTPNPSGGTGTPTGDVSLIATPGPPGTGQVDRFTLTSSGTFSGTTSVLPGGGPYPVIAHYAGNTTSTPTGTFAPSDSNTVLVTISAEASITSVSGPFTQDNFGQYTVPFTSGPFGSLVFVRADVQGISGLGTPTGTVTFAPTVGGIPNSLGSASLNVEGNTSIQTIFFDDGPHTISAAYDGDPSFSASTSTQNPNPSLQSVSFNIKPGFITALGAPSQVAISTPGLSGNIPLNVLASTRFTSAITFTCTGLPTESSCTFSPSSITGSGQTVITVNTIAPHLTQRFDHRPYYLAGWLTSGGFALAGVLFIGWPKRRSQSIGMFLVLLALTVVIPACGGGGAPHHQQDPGTLPGTYNVVVTASGGSIKQTTGFTFFLQ